MVFSLAIPRNWWVNGFDGKNSSQLFFIGDRVEEFDTIRQNLHTIWRDYQERYKEIIITRHQLSTDPGCYTIHFQYYKAFCLTNVSLLVEVTFILLGEGISDDDLSRADHLLRMLVKHTIPLYRYSIVGLNVHNLIHLMRCVKMWGTLGLVLLHLWIL
jgi:hypothetical protein